VTLLLAVALGAAGVWWWRVDRVRRHTLARLDAALPAGLTVAEEPPVPGTASAYAVYPGWYRWMSAVVGVAIASGLWIVLGLPTTVAMAFGLLAAALTYLAEEWLAGLCLSRSCCRLTMPGYAGPTGLPCIWRVNSTPHARTCWRPWRWAHRLGAWPITLD